MNRPDLAAILHEAVKASGAVLRFGSTVESLADDGNRVDVRFPDGSAGSYDLVIDPSNLWLTIHESIGHATELDRALGYEAAYAGTSFATFDQLGTLRYGSPVMQVTGDRTTVHGLATVGYDDEGVAAQSFERMSATVSLSPTMKPSVACRVPWAAGVFVMFTTWRVRPRYSAANGIHAMPRLGGVVSFEEYLIFG